MSNESDYWITVRKSLAPFGRLIRIENTIDEGTPDVAYCLKNLARNVAESGWIELKKIDGFPALPRTPLVVPKLRLVQVQFAEDWEKAGGRSFMLLRAPPWHLLFSAAGIRGVFERDVSAADAPAVAKAAAIGVFPTGRILRALTCA